MYTIDFRSALKQTLKDYNIVLRELELSSNINQQNISSYINHNRGITGDNLEKVIGALPTKARVYFFSLLMSSSLTDV